MCGILGILSSKVIDQTHFTHVLNQTLKHRGPDDFGVYQDAQITLGHRRLSIIDLAGGHQPMFNADRSKVIVFNGEIYNFKALRAELEQKGLQFQSNSDTEVILKLHEAYSPEVALSKLNGIFAYALWDIKNRELIVARDHFGVKPLFYFQNSQAVGFASEVSALQQLLPSAIDPVALRQFLFYEYIPAPRTIYQNIFKLEPGCFLRLKDGKTGIKSYAAPRQSPITNHQSPLPQLEAQLSKSIQMQLVSDVPIGVFLSGGIDSSLIAYYAAQHQPGIQTFSIAFEDPSYDESPYFKMVSKTLNIKSHVQTLKSSDILDIVSKVIPQLDEPLGDPSILPTYLLSQFARQHVTVALSGDGADELFGGYPTYLAHRLTAPLSAMPRSLRHGLAKMIGKLPVSHKNISWDFKLKRFLSGFDYPANVQHQIWMGGISPEMLPQILPNVDQVALFEPLTQKTFKDFMDQDFRMYLQDDLLVKTDRASMLNSLEVRVPFLDPDLVALAYNLPDSYKLRGTTSKYILRKLLKEKFPAAITARPKKGFGIPVSKWLQHELKDVLMAQIEFLGNQNLGFNTTALKNMAQQHFENRVNYRKELWQVLVLGVWLKGKSI